MAALALISLHDQQLDLVRDPATYYWLMLEVLESYRVLYLSLLSYPIHREKGVDLAGFEVIEVGVDSVLEGPVVLPRTRAKIFGCSS